MKYTHLEKLPLSGVMYQGKNINIRKVIDISESIATHEVKLQLKKMTVQKSGIAITPAIDGTFSGHAHDCGYSDYYHGYALLGDFVLLINQNSYTETEIRLVIECEQGDSTIEILSKKCPLLTTEYGFAETHGGLLGCIRCFDETEPNETIDTDRMMLIPAEVFCGSGKTLHLDACGPAARIYVDNFGWRWLFPDADGPLQALTSLVNTDSSIDWTRIKPFLKTASDTERYIVRKHFEAIAYDGHHMDALRSNNSEFFKNHVSRGRVGEDWSTSDLFMKGIPLDSILLEELNELLPEINE